MRERKGMEISNYTLRIKNRVLLQNTSFKFEQGNINHIVGKNGSGKSSFAKDLLLNHSKSIEADIRKNITVISSFSNIPNDIKVKSIIKEIKKRSNHSLFENLYNALGISEIHSNLLVAQLSDGQKQKIKLLVFLSENKDIIILDEITNALDKKTTFEVYTFLNNYIKQYNSKYILNITHNLQDLEYMAGTYYLFENMNIIKYNAKEIVIDKYIKGV